MSISEFELINRYFSRCYARREDISLGVGDDAALLRVPDGHDLAVSTDTLISGVHFFADAAPDDIGFRALAVNLSDLAAMGAQPAWTTLALTIPEADEVWLSAFADAFCGLADQFSMQLVGGDVTRGPLTITPTVYGWVPTGVALKRSGASVGDHIYVTGTLGDAAAALEFSAKSEEKDKASLDYLSQRLMRPTPRIHQAIALRGIASSAIDVSDGLIADLGHVLESSSVGGEIKTAAIPLSPAIEAVADREHALRLALTGGDDYELCFTVPPERAREAGSLWAAWECGVTDVGLIQNGDGLRCIAEAGDRFEVNQRGYSHF